MKLFKKEQGSFGEVKEVSALSDFCCLGKCYGFMRSVLNKKNREGGFTLAEVLITLGIIGVVAALTLPSLISNYRERELITRIKRTYSNIYNAIIMAQKDNDSIGDNSVLFNYDDGYTTVTENFAKYFNGAKVCKSRTKCPNFYYESKFATPMYTASGGTRNWYSYGPKIILNDGAIITIEALYSGCEYDRIDTYYDESGVPTGIPVKGKACATIYFDVNGAALPNRFGQDTFVFSVAKENIVLSSWRQAGGDTLRNILSGKEKLSPSN